MAALGLESRRVVQRQRVQQVRHHLGVGAGSPLLARRIGLPLLLRGAVAGGDDPGLERTVGADAVAKEYPQRRRRMFVGQRRMTRAHQNLDDLPEVVGVGRQFRQARKVAPPADASHEPLTDEVHRFSPNRRTERAGEKVIGITQRIGDDPALKHIAMLAFTIPRETDEVREDHRVPGVAKPG
jgi:hypothetical protein